MKTASQILGATPANPANQVGNPLTTALEAINHTIGKKAGGKVNRKTVNAAIVEIKQNYPAHAEVLSKALVGRSPNKQHRSFAKACGKNAKNKRLVEISSYVVEGDRNNFLTLCNVKLGAEVTTPANPRNGAKNTQDPRKVIQEMADTNGGISVMVVNFGNDRQLAADFVYGLSQHNSASSPLTASRLNGKGKPSETPQNARELVGTGAPANGH